MLARALGGVGLIAASGLVWGLIEAHAFTVRRVSAPVLPGGRDPITILHVSDLHLTPSQRDKVAWVRSLAALTPDAIVTTGDNFGHRDALPSVLEALEPFRALPGAFVLGSNDYFGPRPKNPFGYFSGPSRIASEPSSLPTEDLVAAFESYGWANLTNTRDSMTVRGTSVD
jgi:predicted MPP superfamily phosphohydrolase